MMDTPFQELFGRILRGWWIITLCMIIGGLSGWGFSRLQHPIYEAQAIYTVGFDANQYMLDQGAEDMPPVKVSAVLSTVQDLFLADDVVNAVISNAEDQGYSLTAKQISQNFYIQRIDKRWLLLVRDQDPKVAASYANLWAETALPIIQEAYLHSVEVRALEEEISSVNKCFVGNDFSKGNLCAGTQFDSPTNLEQYLKETQVRLDEVRTASRGLDANLEIAYTKPAKRPDDPVLFPRTPLILAGMLIGLIAGGVLAQKFSLRNSKNDRS